MAKDLYDIAKYIKKCIEKYLKTFNVIIKKDNKKLLLCDGDKKFGVLKYDFNGIELMIETVDISKNKRKIPLKLFKILLLYLISLYIDKGAKHITLYADSSYGQKDNNSKYEGNELRLACYYESLGFKPVKEEEINKYVNLCIEKMNKKETKIYYQLVY